MTPSRALFGICRVHDLVRPMTPEVRVAARVWGGAQRPRFARCVRSPLVASTLHTRASGRPACDVVVKVTEPPLTETPPTSRPDPSEYRAVGSLPDTALVSTP